MIDIGDLIKFEGQHCVVFGNIDGDLVYLHACKDGSLVRAMRQDAIDKMNPKVLGKVDLTTGDGKIFGHASANNIPCSIDYKNYLF